MGRKRRTIVSVLLLMQLLAGWSYASQTGKIRGIVTDKSTGELLTGVNVILNGTDLGAATDENGEYFILQVSPDKYELTCRMIGYRVMIYKDVQVMTDHTTKINFSLERETIDLGGEVIVTAKAPIIQKDVTTSTQFIDSEELRQLPFSDAKEGLMVQTGVFLEPIPAMGGIGSSGKGEARYSIRGGSQEEVKWFVDGVRTSSLIEGKADRGGSFTAVNMHAIQEVQIITSGFNAEYGEAQSGIVNVVTKEGGDKLSASFEFIYGLPGQHHFGNYVYSMPSVSGYLDHSDEMSALYGDYFGSGEAVLASPADSAYMDYLYEVDNQWWSKYQKEYRDNLADTSSTDWSSAAGAYRHQIYEQDGLGLLDTLWWTPYRQENIYDYRKIPDYTAYLSLGGPLFKYKGIRGSFFIASQLKQEAYTLPHPRDSRNLENITYNFALRLSPKMKLRYSGFYNHEAHSTWQEQYYYLNQAKYYRGWGSLLDTYIASNTLHWNHSITTRLFYDLKLSYYQTDFKENPSDYTVLGQSSTVDLWGYQRYEQLPWHEAVEPFDMYSRINQSQIRTSELSLVGSLNWQLNSTNYLKAGFESRYHTYSDKGSWSWPSYTMDPDYWWNRGLHETYHPIQVAFYIQDKMEFESMILNFGLRYDYFNPNYEWFKFSNDFNLAIDPLYDPDLDPDGDQVDENGHVKYGFSNILLREREPAAAFSMLSPRLGVSFPITEKTLLHFNYGHFYQIPPLSQMFEMLYWRPESVLLPLIEEEELAAAEGREPGHTPSSVGDPERAIFWTLEPLKPEKTVSFEVGIKHNFNNLAVLDVTAFYKDASDKTEPRANLFDRRIYGWNPFENQIEASQFYVSLFPGDYGDARGFEASLRTLFSSVITLDINYSFSVSTVGRASPAKIIIDKDSTISYVWDTDVNLRIPVQNSFSRPHILRANLFVRYPDDWHIPVLTPILKGTSASLLYRFVSGQPFTYLKPTDPPDTYDNYRYPASHTVDMRLEKEFQIGQIGSFSAYVQVKNVLNIKNLVSLGEQWWLDPDQAKADYIDNGTIPTTDDLGYDIGWCTYAEPRRINIGIRYNLR